MVLRVICLKKRAVSLLLLSLILCVSGYFATSSVSASGLPSTFGYEGYLTNTSGVAQTGTTTMTVRIYDTPTGGIPIFIEDEGTHYVSNGYFSLVIGSVGDVSTTTVAAALSDLKFDKTYYVTVEMTGTFATGEMLLSSGVRSPFNAVPYAVTAYGVTATTSSAGLQQSGGKMYYDTTLNQLFVSNGATWSALGVAGAGITSLNGLTGLSQFFTISNTGTDITISGSGNNTNTLNIPDAGATSRGVISTTTQTIAGNKIFTGTTTFATTTITKANISDLTFASGTVINLATTNSTSTTGWFSSLLSALSASFTNLTATNATTTNLVAGTFIATGTSTLATATISNLTSPSGTITNLTTTNGSISSLTTTSATSTNLFSTLIQGLTAIFSTLTSSSITGGSITSTSTLNASGTLLVVGTSTLATTTITTLNITGKTILANASSTGGITTTDLYTTNASTTNLSFLNASSTSGLTTGSLYSSYANLGTILGTTGLFSGALSASSTLGVTGATTLYSSLTAVSGLINLASTTISKLTLTGGLYDSTNLAGTLGQVLWSTGTSTQWVATSSLGITGGAGVSGGVLGYATRWLTSNTLGLSSLLDDGNVTGINATTSTSTLLVQGKPGVNPFSVASSTGANLFNILGNGNVGIGTSTPYFNLGVVGTFGITGTSTLATTTISSLSTTGALNASSSLAVTGATLLYSTFSVNGLSTLANFLFVNATGTGVLSVNTSSSTNLTTTNATSTNLFSTIIQGLTAMFSTLTSGTITGGAITSTSTLNASGTLLVIGTSTLATTTISTLSATGVLNASSTLAVTGATTLYSSLTAVSGLINLASTTISKLTLTGGLYDSTNLAGTLGQVLWSTGTSTQWVATSSLGITGGAGVSGGVLGYATRWLTATTLGTSTMLDNGAVVGINATSSSYTFNIQSSTTSPINPFNVASSTGVSLFTILQNGNVGIGSTTLGYLLGVAGTFGVAGTSTLATTTISTLTVAGALNASSTFVVTGNSTLYGTLNVISTSTLARTTATTLMLGTTTQFSLAKVFIDAATNNATGSAYAVAGIHGNYTFNPVGLEASTSVQVGNRFVMNNTPTTFANTAVGEVIRSVDSTILSNTVRGLDILSNAGSNTHGVNTGVRTEAATFGLQAFTSGLAGGVQLPAAIYAESYGTTAASDILRLYTGDMATTSANMANFYQDISNFNGTGILMNLGLNGGTFSGNFMNLQNAGVSKFIIDSTGKVGIGTSTLATTTLTVAGDIRIGNSGTNGCLQGFGGATLTGTCTSDQRLKTNIVEVGSTNSMSMLTRLQGLRVINFNWNDTAHSVYGDATSTLQTGYLAQNVESIFPELVSTSTEGFKQVNYSALGLYAIEGVKQLSLASTQASSTLFSLSGKVDIASSSIMTLSSGLTQASSSIITLAGELSTTFNQASSSIASLSNLVINNQVVASTTISSLSHLIANNEAQASTTIASLFATVSANQATFATTTANIFNLLGNLDQRTSFITTATTSPILHVDMVGNMGLGTAHPLVMLHVANTTATGTLARFENKAGYCDIDPTTKSLVCTTDDSLRTNIMLIDSTSTLASSTMLTSTITATTSSSTLEKLTSLHVVTYQLPTSNGERRTGLLLSDIQALFPDLVKVDQNGLASLSLTNFIPYIIESIKSLALQIDSFKHKFVTDEVIAKNMNSENIKTKNINTELLCVGAVGNQTCLTKSQVDQLLLPQSVQPVSASGGGGSAPSSATSTIPINTATSTPTGTATNTASTSPPLVPTGRGTTTVSTPPPIVSPLKTSTTTTTIP